MIGRPLLLALIFLVPVLVTVGVLLATDRALGRAQPVPADERFPGLAGAWGITDRSRSIGVALAVLVVLAGFTGGNQWHGLTFVVSPLVGALLCVLVVWAGQRLVGRRVAGAVAGLETRRIRDYLPRGLTSLVLVVATLLVAALVGAVVVSAPDGRSITWSCVDEVQGLDGSTAPAVGTSSHSFVGSYYALPLAVLAALLLVVTWLALRAVAARPRNGAEPGIVVADDEVRRRASTLVVAAAGTGLAATLTGLVLQDWSIVRNARELATLPGGCGLELGWGAELLLGTGVWVCLALTVACAARLLSPSSRTLQRAEPSAGGVES